MKPDSKEPSERALSAHHEAGHAVSDCLFGNGQDIDFVACTGKDEDESGRVQLKNPNDVLSVQDIPKLVRGPELECRVIQFILNCFAGPAAECRYEAGRLVEASDWYDESLGVYQEEVFSCEVFASDILDENGNVCETKLNRLPSLTDFEHAFYAAVLFWGSNRDRIDQILQCLAEKANELVADDLVWSEIIDLATRVQAETIYQGVHFAEDCESRLTGFALAEFMKEIQQELLRFA